MIVFISLLIFFNSEFFLRLFGFIRSIIMEDCIYIDYIETKYGEFFSWCTLKKCLCYLGCSCYEKEC